jgi:hypothetical protein
MADLAEETEKTEQFRRPVDFKYSVHLRSARLTPHVARGR